MKTSFLTVLTIFCATYSYAQVNAPTGLAARTNIEAFSTLRGQVVTYDDRYEGTKGTPFLFEEFLKASVLLDTKEFYQGVDIKYNVYKNNFVFLASDSTNLVVEAKLINYVEVFHPTLKKTYKLSKLEGVGTVEPKEVDSFFLVLYNGNKVKLALLPGKNLIKADYKGSGYSSGRTYDEFVNKKSFYFVGATGSINKIKLNKKNLLSSLADKENEIKSFISKEKIDATTEEGWVKVLAFYEQL